VNAKNGLTKINFEIKESVLEGSAFFEVFKLFWGDHEGYCQLSSV
jgi:hypothetical protein